MIVVVFVLVGLQAMPISCFVEDNSIKRLTIIGNDIIIADLCHGK